MSKGERRRTRISSTIDKLPDDIKTELDVRLADTANTYEDLSAWLKAEGYEISKSAIGRYAIRSTQAAQRVAETLQRTQAIAQAVEALVANTAPGSDAIATGAPVEPAALTDQSADAQRGAEQ